MLEIPSKNVERTEYTIIDEHFRSEITKVLKISVCPLNKRYLNEKKTCNCKSTNSRKLKDIEIIDVYRDFYLCKKCRMPFALTREDKIKLYPQILARRRRHRE